MPPVKASIGCIGAAICLGASESLALGLSPLLLEQRRGIIQVTNNSDRLQRVELKVFPIRQVQGRSTAELTPLPPAEAEELIRLRPSSFRLGPGASRVITYSVAQEHPSFYVCGTSLQGLVQARICSRWRSASASAHKQR
jgi:hypothetical protein